MQAIHTKYYGPTDSKSSYVKAYSEGFPRGVQVSWNYDLSVEGNHDAAFQAFATEKEWFGKWARGADASGQGNVYVCIRRSFNAKKATVLS